MADSPPPPPPPPPSSPPFSPTSPSHPSSVGQVPLPPRSPPLSPISYSYVAPPGTLSSTVTPPSNKDVRHLLDWYNALNPSKVDLVGDIAGREPFIIQGESLLRHCLKESQVNFDDGFQILHAVYAVERFLDNLQKRGCDFDIVFFRELRHLCVPFPGGNASKYQLARKVIIKHLQRHAHNSAGLGARAAVLEFESPEEDAFLRYLEPLPIHFIMCHSGTDEGQRDVVQLRSVIYQFVSGGKNVAILNSIEWLSSKVYAPLIGRCSTSLRPIHIARDFDSLHTAMYASADKTSGILDLPVDLTVREQLGISACCLLVQSKALQCSSSSDILLDEQVQAYLLHLAVLRDCTLLERQGWIQVDTSRAALAPSDAGFFTNIVEATLALVNELGVLSDNVQEAHWDLYDLMDGFVFATVLAKLRRKEPLPAQTLVSWKKMRLVFLCLSPMPGIASHEHGFQELQFLDNKFQLAPAVATSASALPFSHAVIDEFLEGIKLRERKEIRDEAADLVFRDLHHWHSTKPLNPNTQRQKPGFFARRRTQKLLADILTYSASLTNARGKLIEPEIVVAKRASAADARDKIVADKRDTKKDNISNKQKGKEKKGQTGKKQGGKENALRAAQEVQEKKEITRQASVVAHWKASLGAIQMDQNLTTQYHKTIHFLYERSKADLKIIGPDVHLHLIHVLGRMWANLSAQPTSTTRSGLHLVALIWHELQQMSMVPGSRAVVQAVQDLTRLIKMPQLPMSVGSQGHSLCFKFESKAFKSMPDCIKDAKAFQLEYGGPYMERRFDSRPDDRVPFDPDAWQRKVLDTIDANNSLLVLAPTSAGKTFISFYAMKKVLEEDDDGVLVYVAPTKALVNQIAAEVGARFTKSYEQPGKSVWAIYTRDYRIQSPTGCQILVTVPHMLQIMLLAPENVKNAKSWSRRIKRIIFDEVHCIGQSQEGVVWEQLLLMAPCPVIALSATIGNPTEFCDWLSMVQARKGLKLEMVVHTSRYSDLRKFIYNSASRKTFTGFNVSRRIVVPGLDEGAESSSNFSFVHPIAALSDRNRSALKDLSLEPRDCLTLLNVMRKALAKTELAKFHMPELETLPAIITKSDVAQWEIKLKDVLKQIMETRGPIFHGICDLLKPAMDGKQNLSFGNDYDEKAASLFNLIRDLHDRNSLPALIFLYDIHGCERTIEVLLDILISAEQIWKSESSEWRRRLDQFEQWLREKDRQPKFKSKSSRSKDKNGDASKALESKLERAREEANVERSPWEAFDPDAPLEQFSLADVAKLMPSEVDQLVEPLKDKVPKWMLCALRRGLGVHHSGLNRQYRQVLEIMFRKGYVRVVVATGTLALGINMPCKTVVFHGDSIFLTAQNYQQASGRAGRRGFDLLGNVVFHGIPRERVFEIISARIPGLAGQFPLSTTLVLRLMTLLHGSNNGAFAVTMVQSLLSQTRLYLGGPEAALSVKHHLRFSIEYLRRQRLLRSDGAPINFAGLVGHLYFTENSVFAFHSLMKGGYFHQVCADIDVNPERVLLEMMLVLCHIFKRLPIATRSAMAEKAHRSSSIVFLPRLPPPAERLLVAHNEETLSIFKEYVQSYISHSLAGKRDRMLPYTRKLVGREKPQGGSLCSEESHMVRSPFVALSGLGDDFKSIHELCETVRSDVFLEESAIPSIPVWPHDTDVELNAYLLDFWKHGSMQVLVRDNGIRRGEVWFHLQDFSRTLATIATSIATLMGSNAGEDFMKENSDDEWEDPSESWKPSSADPRPHEAKQSTRKTRVLDDWQNDEDDSSQKGGENEESSESWNEDWDTGDRSATGWQEKGGLKMVLKAFQMLRDKFDAKFRETWA